MVVVEGVGQPLRQLTRVVIVDVNQRGNAVPFLVKRFRRLADASASEVSDRFRAVLVAAGGDDAVKLQHELVVDGNGHALHGGPSRSGMSTMSRIAFTNFLPLAHPQLSSPFIGHRGIWGFPLWRSAAKGILRTLAASLRPARDGSHRRKLAETGRNYAQTAHDITM